jgi:hypothetical protein
MLSAPAAMPATRHGTFTAAFTPHSPPGRTCSATSPLSLARCARAITGTRPACDTRFGSSKDACVLARLCNNRTYEVSSRLGAGSFIHSHRPSSEGTFHVDTPQSTLIDRWIEAEVA